MAVGLAEATKVTKADEEAEPAKAIKVTVAVGLEEVTKVAEAAEEAELSAATKATEVAMAGRCNKGDKRRQYQQSWQRQQS